LRPAQPPRTTGTRRRQLRGRQTVEHTYAAGRWTATLTARSTRARPRARPATITAYGLTLAGPSPARYGRRAASAVRSSPPSRGSACPSSDRRERSLQRGRRRRPLSIATLLKRPGEYIRDEQPCTVRAACATRRSEARHGVTGSGARDKPLLFFRGTPRAGRRRDACGEHRARPGRFSSTAASPATANQLDTQPAASYRIRTEVIPTEGYVSTVRNLRARRRLPRWPWAAAVFAVSHSAISSASALRCSLRGTFDRSHARRGLRLRKRFHGLPRTGVVDPRFWRAVASPRTALPRFAQPAAHIEVNKGLQVLYVVRASRVGLNRPDLTAGVAGHVHPRSDGSRSTARCRFDPSPLGLSTTRCTSRWLMRSTATLGPALPGQPRAACESRCGRTVSLPTVSVRRDCLRVLASSHSRSCPTRRLRQQSTRRSVRRPDPTDRPARVHRIRRDVFATGSAPHVLEQNTRAERSACRRSTSKTHRDLPGCGGPRSSSGYELQVLRVSGSWRPHRGGGSRTNAVSGDAVRSRDVPVPADPFHVAASRSL